MFRDFQLAYTALARTGLLGPNPLLTVLKFLWCYLRYGGSLYTVAAWTARRFPERIAVVEPGRKVTFNQLVAQAEALARSLNLAPNKTAGLLGRNSVVYVETLLACGRSGVDVLLLNTGFTAEQLLRLAQDRAMDLLICDPEFQLKIEGLSEGLRREGKPVPRVIYTDSLNASGNAKPMPRTRRTGNLILLTSGTTGPAKMIRRKLRLGQMLGMVTALLNQLQPRAGDATLLTIPLLHGHGLATLGLCLTMGAPLYMFGRAQAEGFLQCIEEERVKVLVLVPTILYRLLEHLNTYSSDTSSIRTIVCGSAPLDAQLAARGLERFGPVLYNLYGTSETALISLATPADMQQAPATVGKVLSGVELRILAQSQTSVAEGQSGQVWVDSPLTGGSINTGDVGYLDNAGRLFLLGRQDDMLICGGENVFPQTIEETITHNLGYVAECAAIGVPDPEFGQAIHLFVVLKPTYPDITFETIAQDIKPLFPRATRPKKITLLPLLPRNLAGKILRHQLKTS